VTDKLELVLTPESRILISKISKVGNFSLDKTFEQLGVSYRKEMKAIFMKQQPRGAGLRWAPLNPAYAAWKATNYPDAKGILRRTDRLYDSMTNKNNTENITIIQRFKASFGSRVPYGIFHDSTDNPNRSHPPMRNFSIPGENSIKGMLKSVESAYIQSFQAHGFTVQRVFI